MTLRDARICGRTTRLGRVRHPLGTTPSGTPPSHPARPDFCGAAPAVPSRPSQSHRASSAAARTARRARKTPGLAVPPPPPRALTSVAAPSSSRERSLPPPPHPPADPSRTVRRIEVWPLPLGFREEADADATVDASPTRRSASFERFEDGSERSAFGSVERRRRASAAALRLRRRLFLRVDIDVRALPARLRGAPPIGVSSLRSAALFSTYTQNPVAAKSPRTATANTVKFSATTASVVGITRHSAVPAHRKNATRLAWVRKSTSGSLRRGPSAPRSGPAIISSGTNRCRL